MAMKFLQRTSQSVKLSTRTFIFILTGALAVLFLVYDYDEIISKPPQSVHAWRQADCATQALNYAQRNEGFFRPQLHALVSNDYQTGHAMQEFPIIYYVVGKLFNVFGHHDFLFRGTNLIIFLAALYFLFGLYKKTIGDNFWSLGFTILLFTSPVLVFYANNFILNTPAFAVTIIAWFFFIGFLNSSKQSLLIISMVLFTLGGLLKISELISIFTIVGVLFLDYFKIVRFKNGSRLFDNPYPVAICSALSIAIVFIWYYYSDYYNNFHGQTYYIYTTGSYFSLTEQVRNDIKIIVAEYWSLYYQNQIVLWFWAVTMLFNIVFLRKANRVYLVISSIMLFGSALFVLLFFRYLQNHDYYVISLYITTIFSTITFIDLLLRNYKNLIGHWSVKVIFMALLIYSVHYADQKMKIRYTGWENYVYFSMRDMYYVRPYMEEIGIDKDARVISIPDPTPNLTLYLLNRQGWTNFIRNDIAELIPLAIERGADYLVINDPQLLSHEAVIPHTYHKVGVFGNVTFFKLDGVPNDSFARSLVIETINWDMETLSDDGLSLISDTLHKSIPNQYRTDEFSFSGNHSLKVSPGAFALNIDYANTIVNQEYVVRVKKLSAKLGTSSLIVAISSPDEFYRHVSTGIPVGSGGWEELELRFRVPAKTKSQKMSIHFYNSDNFNIYLDDFSITRSK